MVSEVSGQAVRRSEAQSVRDSDQPWGKKTLRLVVAKRRMKSIDGGACFFVAALVAPYKCIARR